MLTFLLTASISRTDFPDGNLTAHRKLEIESLVFSCDLIGGRGFYRLTHPAILAPNGAGLTGVTGTSPSGQHSLLDPATFFWHVDRASRITCYQKRRRWSEEARLQNPDISPRQEGIYDPV